MNRKPNEADLISALIHYSKKGTTTGVGAESIAKQTLKGGYASKTVERIDLTVTEPAGSQSTVSFVLKECLWSEVRSLAAVTAVPWANATSDVVIAWLSPERPLDQAANGFVSPFYPGGPLTFDDRIPERDASSIDWTWTFDGAHFRRQHERAFAALADSANFRASTPNHIECLHILERLGRSEALTKYSDALPRSLTHGDMYPGNIVLRCDNSPVIIGWGNACVAPPMLDLANIIRIDSPEWRAYLAAYQKAGGAMNQTTCRCAYWWARAATGLQYLPWIAEHTVGAGRRIRQIEEAEERRGNSPNDGPPLLWVVRNECHDPQIGPCLGDQQMMAKPHLS